MALRSIRLVAIFAVLFIQGSAMADDCNFSLTCSSLEVVTFLNGGVNLCGTCLDTQGRKRPSYLNLDAQIGNDKGRLVHPGKGFSGSCFQLSIADGHILKGKCDGGDAYHTYDASIDLNNFIRNSDGVLKPCTPGLISSMVTEE